MVFASAILGHRVDGQEALVFDMVLSLNVPFFLSPVVTVVL